MAEENREIESVIDKVMSRVLTIRDPKGWTKYNVFSRCRYRHEEGILELGFHPDLKLHYLNLQRYMQYNLMEFLLLPSIYSQRIFEFLKSWDDKPETPPIPLTDMHEMLNVPKSSRKNFAEFRRYILEKAYKDIHEHTALHYEWEPIKKGRSVVAIRFIFSKKRALPISEKKEDDAIEKQRAKNNAAFKTAAACLKNCGSACEGGIRRQLFVMYAENFADFFLAENASVRPLAIPLFYGNTFGGALMPLNHGFFLKEQVVALYNLGKSRGLPVDSMQFDEFVDYAYKNAYSIIEKSRHPSPSLLSCHISSNSEHATLLFDGEKLYWQQGCNSTSWPAYSGTEHYLTAKDYSIDAQKSADAGPIPEGWYLVPQERYQERPDDWWEGMKNTFGGGSWPGGSRSWGNQRIWLEPESGTNTYGRTGMSIHGGDVPGSRGCIDLVHNMGEFAKRFKKYGKSMHLEVRYPKKSK